MKHCSKIIETKLLLKIECIHCSSLNYVSCTVDDDPSKFDVEEITCWKCDKSSLAGEEMLDYYSEYPDESVGGHFFGKSSV